MGSISVEQIPVVMRVNEGMCTEGNMSVILCEFPQSLIKEFDLFGKRTSVEWGDHLGDHKFCIRIESPCNAQRFLGVF